MLFKSFYAKSEDEFMTQRVSPSNRCERCNRESILVDSNTGELATIINPQNKDAILEIHLPQ